MCASARGEARKGFDEMPRKRSGKQRRGEEDDEVDCHGFLLGESHATSSAVSSQIWFWSNLVRFQKIRDQIYAIIF